MNSLRIGALTEPPLWVIFNMDFPSLVGSVTLPTVLNREERFNMKLLKLIALSAIILMATVGASNGAPASILRSGPQ